MHVIIAFVTGGQQLMILKCFMFLTNQEEEPERQGRMSQRFMSQAEQ